MDDMQQIPYIAYEAEQARNERHIKRLIVALIISIALIFASNAIWLWAWCRYDYSSEDISYSQDGQGINNINAGTQGDIDNGSEIESAPSQTN